MTSIRPIRSEETVALYALRLLVQVPDEKHLEFVQSLSVLLEAFDRKPTRTLFMQDRTQEGLFCCMTDWGSRKDLDAFLHSNTYRSLRGAIAVLGNLVEERVITGRS